MSHLWEGARELGSLAVSGCAFHAGSPGRERGGGGDRHTHPPAVQVHGLASASLEICCLIQEVAHPPPPPVSADSGVQKARPLLRSGSEPCGPIYYQSCRVEGCGVSASFTKHRSLLAAECRAPGTRRPALALEFSRPYGVLKTLLSSGEPVCPPPCLEVSLPGLHASEGIHIRGALCTVPAMEQKYQ
ncbi:unnamed protein product [Rangifer tarandus platyrhynchus]|uniref:Uncharacterized protein n=2 Tax=Rangifer tarandus platyrhynchus TaxID=3082113 RepID=A0AC59YB66_RANTA|nr:unnamed protein product [Rangifer tarandus platyrhynchus]